MAGMVPSDGRGGEGLNPGDAQAVRCNSAQDPKSADAVALAALLQPKIADASAIADAEIEFLTIASELRNADDIPAIVAKAAALCSEFDRS